MRIRVVVADRAEASFYDIQHPDAALAVAATLTDPKARLHDRDFKSDRPGRVFDHAPGAGRHGAVAHHSTGGENTPRTHEAEVFARRIAADLEEARRAQKYDRLVLVAEPGFLGVLRQAIPAALRACVALEVHKDLVHQGEAAIKSQLPRSLFVAA